MTSVSNSSFPDDVYLPQLYYSDKFSIDEDEFVELAANCVVGVQRALSSSSRSTTDSSKQLVLDRNCTVYGQFVDFEAINKELSPMPAFGERSEGEFALLLYDEPFLALALLQTVIHSMV